MHRRPHRYGTLARAISGILCATGALAPAALRRACAGRADPSDPSADVVVVTGDPLRALGTAPSDSSFGFTKSLLETPRSVSFISEQQINLFGISTVDDLTRLVPGTFTNTRYGLQGGVNVRGVPSDMYYRGMKRLQMQGHVRTVLSAMDGIEVIKGPPSPIFGMGRIGGYQNLVPKSSRASTGAYMSRLRRVRADDARQLRPQRDCRQASAARSARSASKAVSTCSACSRTRTRMSSRSVRARSSCRGRSRSKMRSAPSGSSSADRRRSRSRRALVLAASRRTWSTTGTYLRGQPMVNLDFDGDGRIGVVESYTASPVRGNDHRDEPGAEPAVRVADRPAALCSTSEDFPQVPGIPATMLDYLNAHPEIDCHAADVMRSMPAGGPLPLSGQLPVGMVLDPCTVSYAPVDYRGNGAFEREQNADQRLAFIDLINDSNPDFTMKNQFLYDNINSFKDSWQPYGENQYIKAVEEKFTVTKRISDENLPDWVRINMLGSVNYRKTSGWIKSSGGDFNWRQDMYHNGGYSYPNTMFWTQLTNPDYATGAPDTRWLSSEQDNAGLGVMFDIDLFTNTNVILGGRYDQTDARATEIPTFTESAGVSPRARRRVY